MGHRASPDGAAGSSARMVGEGPPLPGEWHSIPDDVLAPVVVEFFED